MNEPAMAIVIPTYGHYTYAALAARSALENFYASIPFVYIIDDNHPDWDTKARQPLCKVFKDHALSMRVLRLNANQGLTYCWNLGLQLAIEKGFDYIAVTNSDVIFPPCWDMSIIAALDEREYSLVGPITNAPGTCKEQDASLYVEYFRVTDDIDYLNKLSKQLQLDYGSMTVDAVINGFCMIAKTKTWNKYRYDNVNIFKPRNDFNSKGERNPTPLMTLQEYELQGRWKNLGLKTGVCPGSFVLHYRSISRGDRFKKGNWLRMEK